MAHNIQLVPLGVLISDFKRLIVGSFAVDFFLYTGGVECVPIINVPNLYWSWINVSEVDIDRTNEICFFLLMLHSRNCYVCLIEHAKECCRN